MTRLFVSLALAGAAGACSSPTADARPKPDPTLDARNFTKAPLRVTKVFQLDASPEEVWKVVGDHQAVPTYFPMVREVKVDSSAASTPGGEGAVRSCAFGDMGHLTEDIRVHRPAEALGYTVRDGNPMGVTEHFALITLTPTRTGTRLTWRQYFEHPQPQAVSAQIGQLLDMAGGLLQKRFAAKKS